MVFRLPCPPLAKRGSLTHSQALALSKRARDVTAPPVALNRFALWLADHQRSRQGCFSGDEPAGGRLAETFFCGTGMFFVGFNAIGFIPSRSLFHRPTKLTSSPIEACFIFSHVFQAFMNDIIMLTYHIFTMV